MRLNNKGFAITSIVYSILVLFLALVLLILNNIAVRQNIFEKQKQEILGKLETHTIRYYSLESGNIDYGLPSDASRTAPSGNNIYLGFDSADGTTIEAAYVCFIQNNKTYCIKGGDGGTFFSKNQDILNNAFAPPADFCSFDSGYYTCSVGDWYVEADLQGYVYAFYDFADCTVYEDGDFECTDP